MGQLGGHARMVLMSNGVVEAPSKTGELYGFDRLAPLTLQSAQEIAATAQAFGQEDDITVVSIACQPRREPQHVVNLHMPPAMG